MGDAKSTQPDAMEGTAGDAVYLPCSHSTISGNEYIYWYRQIPRQGPEYLIYGLKGNVTQRGASLTIAADRKSSTLVLPRVTLGDSAVYYCIVRDPQWQGRGCTCAVSPRGWEAAAQLSRPPHRRAETQRRGRQGREEKRNKVKRGLRKSRRKG